MIPGGKSGLRYLRENGLLNKSVVPMSDDRDRVVSVWLKENPRKGLPAPWVAENGATIIGLLLKFVTKMVGC